MVLRCTNWLDYQPRGQNSRQPTYGGGGRLEYVCTMTRHVPQRYSSSSAKLVYGVDAAGRIRHISEVDRGFACGCVCPACAAPLNARKGDEKVHHFGHRGSFSCANAPETALHKLAKEIVSTKRRLFVPEVKAEYKSVTKVIHGGKIVCFDKAVEEARHLKDLVPDVHVERGGHHLLIEIYVTHACDELKRSGLRDSGIAAVEIDLSRFPRDASRSEVQDAVIEHAERRWLFHPKIDAAVDAMRAAHRAEEDAHNGSSTRCRCRHQRLAALQLRKSRHCLTRPDAVPNTNAIRQNRGRQRAGKIALTNLSASLYIDLGGSRMLHELHGELAARGAELRIVGAHSSVRDLLRADRIAEKVGGSDRSGTLDNLLGRDIR